MPPHARFGTKKWYDKPEPEREEARPMKQPSVEEQLYKNAVEELAKLEIQLRLKQDYAMQSRFLLEQMTPAEIEADPDRVRRLAGQIKGVDRVREAYHEKVARLKKLKQIIEEQRRLSRLQVEERYLNPRITFGPKGHPRRAPRSDSESSEEVEMQDLVPPELAATSDEWQQDYSQLGGTMSSRPRSKKLMTRAMRTAASSRRSSKITAESGVRFRDATTGRFVSMRTLR